ncbi:amino acid transporter [Bacillus thuringiensis]|uniref:Uncharacterized protein n=2 Tax=Bacillus thuringiensis TaxID=1428 RepID=A0AB36U2F2_BACTU|nr:hypothetical protein CAB88_29430 [Bacillus thuringiensis]OTW40031.1 hypothetical protein BK698_18660 [Bacillus thuringiensis serovar thuringiensis]AST05155.1 hypothetical protein BT10792_32045 [Bacillus thuringiensis]MBG9621495.1 amino acid transporter [Bacillus thuringiensis]MBG9661494.1 amino acid transporter [Bacillus thuringiensis]
MSGTIMILLYICFGMSAVFSLIKEFGEPQINRFLVLVDPLILLGALFLVDNIFISF